MALRPLANRLISRGLATSSAATPKAPTAVVMLNMGGPADPKDTGSFLSRLFNDPEIVSLGKFQKVGGSFLAKRRTPKVTKQYEAIGGSPIRKWTTIQGKEMVKRLDALSPQTAPHKPYIAFRYADPLTEECIAEMKADGVTRAIAFSQYPQWSCTTAGSSINNLWREVQKQGLAETIQWSVIDRWYSHPTFIKAVVRCIQRGLEQFPAHVRDQVIILFSAHSLPMKVVNRGDPYSKEVASTVEHVMAELHRQSCGANVDAHAPEHSYRHPYLLCWQSQVGFLPWLGPQTGEAIANLGKQGHKQVLVVPIAFTSDHIETLYEIDIEYKHVADKAGVHLVRAPSLNDEPLIFDAFAEIVASHLKSGEVASRQYGIKCHGCERPECRTLVNPIKPYSKLCDVHTRSVSDS